MLLQALHGEYVVLQAALPGRPVENIGVLLLDPSTGQLHTEFRRDWGEFIEDDEDVEIFEALGPDLESKAEEMGGTQLLEWLEEHCSHAIRLTERESVLVDSFRDTARRLYRKHVAPKVLPFRTHLPLYSARAAAGSFGERMEVEPEGWIETPPNLRLTDDMFVAHVTGRSMEPRIPDGSLCVFRANVKGSRQGKLVLVENYGETGENRYTIKRYTSIKSKPEPGSESLEDAAEWRHERIILEPLNPEFEPWDLDENARIRVLAEFVAVLEP
jgi:SOS-response transcriptional repressor LexA